MHAAYWISTSPYFTAATLHTIPHHLSLPTSQGAKILDPHMNDTALCPDWTFCLLGALAARRQGQWRVDAHASSLPLCPGQGNPTPGKPYSRPGKPYCRTGKPYCRRCLVRLPPASCWSTPASSNASGSSTLCEDANPAGAAASFGSCTRKRAHNAYTQTLHAGTDSSGSSEGAWSCGQPPQTRPGGPCTARTPAPLAPPGHLRAPTHQE